MTDNLQCGNNDLDKIKKDDTYDMIRKNTTVHQQSHHLESRLEVKLLTISINRE